MKYFFSLFIPERNRDLADRFIFLFVLAILFSAFFSQAQNPSSSPASSNDWVNELLKPAGANGPMIVDDDFSSNQTNWHIGNDSVATTKIESHQYKIKPGKGQGIIYSMHTFDLNDNHDWKIEAEMISTSSNEQAAYGIIFGSSTSGSKTYFVIMNSGAALWVKDGTTMDASEDAIKYINTGAGEMNKLTIQHVTRKEWSFRLNDKEIFASKEYDFSGNQFGFITETEVSVGHFKIYDWSKSEGMADSLVESDYGSAYFDSFHSGDQDWQLENDEGHATTLVDDAMRMELKEDVAHFVFRDVSLYGGDFRIDLLCSRLHSVDASNSVGIIFGREENDDRFYFCIDGNGRARLYQVKDGEWVNWCDWISSDEIHSTDGADNLLSVEQKKNHWYLRVNGATVYSCDAHRFNGTGYGWQLEGLTAIKVKSFNVCQGHIPTIKYANAEVEAAPAASFDLTTFSKQFVDLMCAAPSGFSDYVGDVTDRHDDFVGYESKLILSGGHTYYFYERGKSGKKFHGWMEFNSKEKGENAFNQITSMIEGATSTCFSLERTNGKPPYPDGVSKFIEWQDKNTKNLVQLSLEQHGSEFSAWMVRIIIGKKEK